MAAFNEKIMQLSHHMQQLRPTAPPQAPTLAAAPPAPPPSPASSVVSLAPPERFSGDSGDCRPFLAQCSLHFGLQLALFPSERTKVAYIISRLSGRAEAWATAEWKRDTPLCNSLAAFTNTMRLIFQHTCPGREAASGLMWIQQGSRCVGDYVIKFQALAYDSEWNSPALLDTFLDGLSEPMKDQLTPLELLSSLELIALAIKIDNQLHDHNKEHQRTASSLMEGSPETHHRLTAILLLSLQVPPPPW